MTLSALFSATESVMSRPRKVYVVKTEHFDILFPSQCKETANLLLENADNLYELAKSETGFKQDLHIPVVISPDSDSLSVTYTQSPYNRIVVFDSVGQDNQTSFKDSLLGLFYHEIYRALSKAIRTPLHQFISKFAGESYEPVSLVNLPFSFIEGRAYLAEGQASDPENPEKYGRYNDSYFLQILSQAKYEKKFPSYYECSVTLDIYPGNELLFAATSAFTAYLIQTYGYEKFEKYWLQCGAMHLYFMPGIFYFTYGEFLNNVWKKFVETIPLPENLNQMEILSSEVEKIFETDQEGLYQHFIYSEYGYIWYDGIRHEVDLYDYDSPFKLRQLLFLADKIDRMILSPDGRYLTVSYRQVKNRAEFEKKVTWIYDLKERTFLKQSYPLRDACLLLSDQGELLIAGVNVQKKYPVIQIYKTADDEDDQVLLYEQALQKNAVPSCLCAPGKNQLSYLITENNEISFVQLNYVEKSQKTWKLKESDDIDLDITNLRLVKKNSQKIRENKAEDFAYTFQYISGKGNSFVRMGYILLDENFSPEKILLQNEDLPGGLYSPFIKDKNVYYCAKKLHQNELSYIQFDKLTFSPGQLKVVENVNYDYVEEDIQFDGKTLNGKELATYFPLKYMFPLSVIPMLPVHTITLEDGAIKWPGLGATITTHSDPFLNNKFTLSAGWSFLDLEMTQAFNAPLAFLLEIEEEESDIKKDKSLSFFFENSSTPVDIKAGGLFRFNLDGEYKLEAIAGTAWTIPKGMDFSKVVIDVQSLYCASTDYYDSYLKGTDEFKSMSNWPALNKSYDFFELSATGYYSNLHQYGVNPFEKRGLKLGARLYFFCDLYSLRLVSPEIQALNKKVGKIAADGHTITQDEINKANNFIYMRVSQLNLGLFGEIDIPRLTPLQMWNGFVLSLPAKVTAEFLNKTGTALEVNPEILLLGWEPHNGFRTIMSYIARIGVTGGYDFRLDYDTSKVQLPDLRRENYLGSLLSSCFIDDNLYLKINMDVSSPIGVLSSEMLSFEFIFSYYPRTSGCAFSMAFVTTF